MGKVRPHIARDDHALAEWIRRKIVNHDPMTVREDGSAKKKKGLAGERVRHQEGTSQVVYCAAGKVFQIDVQEVDEPIVGAQSIA